jgi:hypothetical protein
MVDQIFSSITSDDIKEYTRYWKSIAPKNNQDIFRRWLFAYTSIKTTWEANVRGYNAIKNFDEWIGDKELLRAKLIEAKCGLHNMRADYIWQFSEQFFGNNKDFRKNRTESWTQFRDRLVKQTKGIGITKVSFTLEMCYPDKAEVVCLDTHMLQLYGVNSQKFDVKSGKNIYLQHEQDWITRSKELNSAPCITRAIYWDRKQNQENSRYWSYVLE